MARPLRIEFENAWYHVMNRGAGRQNIFLRDFHREVFLKVLGEATELFGLEVHAYCLMNNHYHLLLKTPQANLSRAMRHINGVYTQRFNRIERKDGPLFRGRYKSIIIDEENYLVSVSRYIHRNPVEAKICQKANDYLWSSYRSYLNLVQKPEWLYIQEVLARVHPIGRESYKALVDNALVPSLAAYYRSNRISPVLGGKAFKISVETRAAHLTAHPEIPEARSLKHNQWSMNDILGAVSDVTGCSNEDLCQSIRGKRNPARYLAIYIARKKCGYPLSSIGQAFGISAYSTVSNMVRQFGVALENDSSLMQQVATIEKKLRRN